MNQSSTADNNDDNWITEDEFEEVNALSLLRLNKIDTAVYVLCWIIIYIYIVTERISSSLWSPQTDVQETENNIYW